MTDDQKLIYGSHNTWSGRSLSNYQSLNAESARKEGKYDVLMSARTLTEARKIMHGVKPRQKRVKK